MDDDSSVRDVVFLLLATLLHASLLAANPALKWGSPKKAPSKAILVDFVAQAPSPLLAPVPASDGNREGIPGYGSGKFRREKIKAEPGKKAVRKVRRPRKKKSLHRRKRDQRRRMLAKARRARRRENIRLAREQAEWRAEEKRERARIRRGQRLARRRKRAELSRQLSVLDHPDEAISDASPAVPAPAAGALNSGLKDAMADSDALYDSGGGDDEDLRPAGGPATPTQSLMGSRTALLPAGGGIGKGGGDVSWSIEGAAGDRRLLSRSLPKSPDWVAKRGLDLRVRIRFSVRADGKVRGAVIKETSGFPELDKRALRALKKWRFDPIPGESAAGPQTIGVVTLRFTV